MHCDPHGTRLTLMLTWQLKHFQRSGRSGHWIRDSDSGGTLGILLSVAEQADNLNYSLI